MSVIATHGACGATWKQRGNGTGPCSACHRTFEGLALFDWHQTLGDDGRVICRDPANPKWASKGLRLVEGTWRGPEWAKAAFEGAS